MPTPDDYNRWHTSKEVDGHGNMDSPLVGFESFHRLARVRPGIKDLEALKRQVRYKGKDRHAADAEGDADASDKAFFIKSGLKQGVLNFVCPHTVTLVLRCLFRSESVREALSIILERFPILPEVSFYEVACRLDKNALRRGRPILREHKARCILDRPHSTTRTCSPIYMPDENLGSTAGVATQAAEVSHSIAVANRTSSAFLPPQTYMVHKMVQVAMMNIRKLQRLASSNTTGENADIPLAPFFHGQLARGCQSGSSCACQYSIVETDVRQTETELRAQIVVSRPSELGDSPKPDVADLAGDQKQRGASAGAVPGDTAEAVVIQPPIAAAFDTLVVAEDLSVAGGDDLILAPMSTQSLSDVATTGLQA